MKGRDFDQIFELKELYKAKVTYKWEYVHGFLPTVFFIFLPPLKKISNEERGISKIKLQDYSWLTPWSIKVHDFTSSPN